MAGERYGTGGSCSIMSVTLRGGACLLHWSNRYSSGRAGVSIKSACTCSYGWDWPVTWGKVHLPVIHQIRSLLPDLLWPVAVSQKAQGSGYCCCLPRWSTAVVLQTADVVTSREGIHILPPFSLQCSLAVDTAARDGHCVRVSCCLWQSHLSQCN